MKILLNQMRKTKAVYSELAIDRKESASIACVLAETQRQIGGVKKLYSEERGKFQVGH